MTEREQFEKAFPAPQGVEWNESLRAYCWKGTQFLCAHQDWWNVWQARATPALPQGEHDLEDVRCQCCGYMTYHREHMGCIRSAYKQALPQVPEGMAIVPAEPTLEMINAALPHAMRESDDEKYRAIGEIICIWYEMLAAAKEKGE